MQKYKGVRYDGDYTYKGKRIARITPIGYTAMGDAEFRLSLKLKYMDNYADFIQELPEGIKKPMQEDSCCYCGFQGSTKEYCKFRLHSVSYTHLDVYKRQGDHSRFRHGAAERIRSLRRRQPGADRGSGKKFRMLLRAGAHRKNKAFPVSSVSVSYTHLLAAGGINLMIVMLMK